MISLELDSTKRFPVVDTVLPAYPENHRTASYAFHFVSSRRGCSLVSAPSALQSTDEQAEELNWAKGGEVARLYQRYGQRTLAFLVSLGLSRDDAEDVHHQVWMKIIQILPQQSLEGSFRAWMFQVMRNSAVDWMRKKKPALVDSATMDATANDPACEGVEASFIQQEYHDALARCLAQLDETARELVRGRLSGQDYPQLAATLHLEVARAHRVFFDAKESLTRCVRVRMGDES